MYFLTTQIESPSSPPPPPPSISLSLASFFPLLFFILFGIFRIVVVHPPSIAKFLLWWCWCCLVLFKGVFIFLRFLKKMSLEKLCQKETKKRSSSFRRQVHPGKKKKKKKKKKRIPFVCLSLSLPSFLLYTGRTNDREREREKEKEKNVATRGGERKKRRRHFRAQQHLESSSSSSS